MAIYYLSPTGLAVPPYDTWEKAANNLHQILSLSLSGENTIYVAEGLYLGSLNRIILDDAKFANLILAGVGLADNIIFGNSGSNNTCYIGNLSITNVLVDNVSLYNDHKYVCYIDRGYNIRFTRCNIEAKGNQTGNMFVSLHDSSVILNFCKAKSRSYTTENLFYTSGDSSLQINYSRLYSPNGSPANMLYHNSTKDVNVNNCVLAKCRRQAVSHVGTGNLTISNSILIGAGREKNSNPTVYRVTNAGTTLIRNSIVFPSMYYPDKFFSDGVITENVQMVNPRFKNSLPKGFLIPRVDDNNNIGYAKDFSTLLKEYNYRGTFHVNTWSAATIAEDLRNLVTEGAMEIANHTHTHQDMSYDHALHFVYTGSDTNPTVELDSSRVIHLRTDGSDNVDIDTTQDNANTLGGIINHFNGVNNWTISKSTTDGQNVLHIQTGCSADSLLAMPATAAPCDIDFWKDTGCENGCPGLYGSEIYEPRIKLTNLINAEGDIIDPQTGQIYEARTFVPPFGAGDENLVEALRTSGYLGAGGINYFVKKSLPHNVYKIPAIGIGALITRGDETQTTKNAELFAINIAISGLAITILAHDAEEATLEEWRWVLNGFKAAQKYYDIQVTSLQLAIEGLKKLGSYNSSTGDLNIHWSMPSFRLRHDSPCIDTGKKLPIHDENWQDLVGNKIRYGSAPDIGCYEVKTWPLEAWGVLPWVGNRYKVQWTPYEE